MGQLPISLSALSLALVLSSCADGGVYSNPTLRSNIAPVFLVVGQSNSVSPAQEHAPHYSSTGLVRVNDYYHEPVNATQFRVPTRDNPIDSSVCWIYLGDMLKSNVTFYNVAAGNTSTRRWKESYWRRFEDVYLREPGIKFTAALWVQGESDWNEGISEQESYENLKFVIEKSREFQPDLVWFIALNSGQGAIDPGNRIRRAQMRLIADGYALEGPDTDTIRRKAVWVEDAFGEFVGGGLKEHGRMWFEVLKPFLAE